MKYKLKKLMLYISCAAAILGVSAVAVFLIVTLTIRTNYKDMALRVNDAVLETYSQKYVEKNGERYPADDKLLNYYDKFLLDGNTAVFNSSSADETEKTIRLIMGDKTLALTPLEDGTAINIHWKTPDEDRSFTVRSQTSYMQLEAYLSNYINRIKDE